MAAWAHIQCPNCGTSIPITLVAKDAGRRDGALIVDVEPDLTDVWAHAWTHDEGVDLDCP